LTTYSIGSQTTLTGGANSGVLIQLQDASNTYKYLACEDFKASWGYTISENYVSATNNPFMITEKFTGEVTLRAIYSTEITAANEQLANFMGLTNGAISSLTLIWKAQDTQGAPALRTFTLTSGAWPDKYDFSLPGEKKIFNQLHLKMSAPPVVS
jgi:hypothetical protein